MDRFSKSKIIGKSFAVELALSIIVYNFIIYHKFIKRNYNLFETTKKNTRNFVIYFIATLGITAGSIIINEIK